MIGAPASVQPDARSASKRKSAQVEMVRKSGVGQDRGLTRARVRSHKTSQAGILLSI